MATIKTPRRQAGFTYLWLLLLVGLMGVGLTVAAELDSTSARRDREKELLAIGRQFQTALGRYHEIQGPGGQKEYPNSLEDLLRDPRVPGVRRHLRQVFIDPMTATPQWGLRNDGSMPGSVASEQMPIKQAGFAPEHQTLSGKKKYSEWLFVYPPGLVLPVDGKDSPQAMPPATGTGSPALDPGAAVPSTQTTTPAVTPLKEDQP